MKGNDVMHGVLALAYSISPYPSYVSYVTAPLQKNNFLLYNIKREENYKNST